MKTPIVAAAEGMVAVVAAMVVAAAMVAAAATMIVAAEAGMTIAAGPRVGMAMTVVVEVVEVAVEVVSAMLFKRATAIVERDASSPTTDALPHDRAKALVL